MSELKDKMDYLEKSFQAGKSSLNDTASSVFLRDILEDLSADPSNYNEYRDKIPMLYNACLNELDKAPSDIKPILLSSVIKNMGIDNLLKEDQSTKLAVFEDLLKNRDESTQYKDLNNVFNHSFDDKNKRIDLDLMLDLSKAITMDLDSDRLANKLVNNPNFNDNISKVLASFLAFKDLSEIGDYDLTSNQNKIIEEINEQIIITRKKNNILDEQIEKELPKYKKYSFTNEKTVESQIHGMREEQNMDGVAGIISSHSIETPLRDVKESLKKKELSDSEILIEQIEWEEKYKEFLKSIGNIKIMTTQDKFAKKFASHGFAPATSSLFGNSIILTDKFGDPQKTLWNISPLTGTMRLGKDINYAEPELAAQAFNIAALNARRNGWDSVYLNHPGPDQEAKHFLESSIRAMIEVGHYEFDDINVPKKYAHILAHFKNEYISISPTPNLDEKYAPLNETSMNPEKAIRNDQNIESIETEQVDNRKPDASQETIKSEEAKSVDEFFVEDNSVFDQSRQIDDAMDVGVDTEAYDLYQNMPDLGDMDLTVPDEIKNKNDKKEPSLDNEDSKSKNRPRLFNK